VLGDLGCQPPTAEAQRAHGSRRAGCSVGDAFRRSRAAPAIQRTDGESRRRAAASGRGDALAECDQGDDCADGISGVAAAAAVRYRATGWVAPAASAKRDVVSAQVLRLSTEAKRHASAAVEVPGDAASGAGEVTLTAAGAGTGSPAIDTAAATCGWPGGGGCMITPPGCAAGGASAGTATSFTRITTRPMRLSPSRSTCLIA